MAEQSLEEYLGDVLNNRIPVVKELADLPSLWRDAPLESYGSNHLGLPDRWTLLAIFIDMADTKPWAREGLRRLLRELLEKDGPIPDPLVRWVLHQFARGDPAPRRGRPEESDRNFRVLAVFEVLRAEQYTREAAMALIAEHLVCEPETIRSIIRNLEKYLRPR